MTEPASLPRVTIHMFGTRGLFRRENLEPVLADLEAHPRFVPATWSLQEREASPYARDEIIARLAASADRPLAQTSLFLRRRRVPSYEATLTLWERARLGFEFTAAAGDYPGVFGLADRMADLFQPDFGAVHVWVGRRPRDQLGEPWSNDDERDADLMARAAAPVPVAYYRIGPSGLAMRTYVGPRLVAELGEARVESLALELTKLSWGGYRIDLVREPWTAELSVLLDAWRRGMARLASAEVLAVPKTSKGRFLEFEKNLRGPSLA